MHSWNIFGALMNHGHTQTHKTHHGLDLREATTFPTYSIFYDSPWGLTQIVFFLGLHVGVLEIGTPTTLEAHNFLCKLSIEAISKAKL
jgi:hypothetical protein